MPKRRGTGCVCDNPLPSSDLWRLERGGLRTNPFMRGILFWGFDGVSGSTRPCDE